MYAIRSYYEPDAIKLLTEKAKDYEGIEVQSLKVKYPQGGEKQP